MTNVKKESNKNNKALHFGFANIFLDASEVLIKFRTLKCHPFVLFVIFLKILFGLFEPLLYKEWQERGEGERGRMTWSKPLVGFEPITDEIWLISTAKIAQKPLAQNMKWMITGHYSHSLHTGHMASKNCIRLTVSKQFIQHILHY